jgi:carbon monoxide dehydrogenase subunit G
MELSNEFEVSVPIEQAWAVLTDLERIAPCLPGAQLQEVEGEDYRGIVKVKVGPITAQYKGTARFVEKDDVAHRVLLSASGRDTRGQGTASASIVATLSPAGPLTHVSVVTDLTITGKVAQFGRGVIGEVSGKLLDQFVAQLESTVLASAPADSPGTGTAGTADPSGSSDSSETADPVVAAGDPVDARADAHEPVAASAERPAPRVIDSGEAVPIDLLGTAGSPLVKRLVPVFALALVAAVIVGLLRRRRA